MKMKKKRREVKELEIEELQIKHKRLLAEYQRLNNILNANS
ncbi:hypothetical protein [Bacillus sp. FJAT-53711]